MSLIQELMEMSSGTGITGTASDVNDWLHNNGDNVEITFDISSWYASISKYDSNVRFFADGGEIDIPTNDRVHNYAVDKQDAIIGMWRP